MKQFAAIADRLKPIETAADRLCHRLYEQLDRTFVTPIDREETSPRLTNAFDNVIDSMETLGRFRRPLPIRCGDRADATHGLHHDARP